MSEVMSSSSNLRPDYSKDTVLVSIEQTTEIDSLVIEDTRVLDPPVIYSHADLLNDPALLHDVVAVINDAFWPAEEGFDPDLRFPQDQDLLDQFGEDALCAVIRVGKQIIATASIVPWRELRGSVAEEAFKQSRADDHSLMEDGQSYELRAVAVVDDPVSRKKGLVTKCLVSLQDVIFSKNGGSDFIIWLHTSEKLNGAYWRRRGFDTVCIEWKPAGFWSALKDFPFATLAKRVSMRSE